MHILSKINRASVHVTAMIFIAVFAFSSCSKTDPNSIEGCWKHEKYQDRFIKVGSDSMWAYLKGDAPVAYKVHFEDEDCNKAEQQNRKGPFYYVEYKEEDGSSREECYEILEVLDASFIMSDGQDTFTFIAIPCEQLDQ